MRLSYCNPGAPTADAGKSQPAVPEGGLSAGQGQGSHYPGDGRMNPALLPAEPLATAPPVGPGPALNGEVIARLAGSGAAKTPVAVGQSGPADAQALDRKAAAPATPHVYKAEWAHYAAWCAQAGIAPLSADPAGVGSYLTSLAKSHAPSTIRRRLSAIGKMHRDNDLPWNPSHRAIQEPLQAVLRTRGRPVQKPAAVSFGRDSAFGLSFEGRAVMMGIACVCLLLLLSTLFWMLLKGAVVLAAFLYLVARFSARGIGPSTPQPARVEAASSAARASARCTRQVSGWSRGECWWRPASSARASTV